MSDYKHIGSNIRELRKAKGMSQARLAEAINTSQQSIARYEQGKVEPKFYVVVDIANALGVPLFSILGDDAKVFYDKFGEQVLENLKGYSYSVEEVWSIEEQTLLDFYRLLNTEGRAQALKQIWQLAQIRDYIIPDLDNKNAPK